jgi:hypothetical protein
MIILILIWHMYKYLIHVCVRLCPSEKIVLCRNVIHALHINKTEKETFKFGHNKFPLNWHKWERVQRQLILELVNPGKQ